MNRKQIKQAIRSIFGMELKKIENSIHRQAEYLNKVEHDLTEQVDNILNRLDKIERELEIIARELEMLEK